MDHWEAMETPSRAVPNGGGGPGIALGRRRSSRGLDAVDLTGFDSPHRYGTGSGRREWVEPVT